MALFNESTLENAIMELFENEIHYTHCLGEQLHKNLSEVVLNEELEAYLRSAYPDMRALKKSQSFFDMLK